MCICVEFNYLINVDFTVNNFQSIRNELFDEVKEYENSRQLQIKTEEFNIELANQATTSQNGYVTDCLL